MHWTSFKNEGTLKAMACSVRRRRNLRVRDVNYRTGRLDQTDGQKTQDLQTSLGFFDLAIAAPSMKAALERGRRQQSPTKALRRRATIRAASPRPPHSLASFSRARSDPTDISASLLNCPPILVAADQRKASRKAQRRRSLLSPCRRGCRAKGRARLRTGTEAPRC